MIVIEEIWTVQSYIEIFIDDCPNHIRPRVCPHCQAEGMLHKHGSFKRTVYTLLDVFTISIFRFKCIRCQKSTSLLPNSVMEHHQVAWEVKEEVIRQQLSGVALAKIAEDLVTSVEKLSEKTLWRWSKAIRDELRMLVFRTMAGYLRESAPCGNPRWPVKTGPRMGLVVWGMGASKIDDTRL